MLEREAGWIPLGRQLVGVQLKVINWNQLTLPGASVASMTMNFLKVYRASPVHTSLQTRSIFRIDKQGLLESEESLPLRSDWLGAPTLYSKISCALNIICCSIYNCYLHDRFPPLQLRVPLLNTTDFSSHDTIENFELLWTTISLVALLEHLSNDV